MNTDLDNIDVNIAYNLGTRIFYKIIEPLIDEIDDIKVTHTLWVTIFRHTTLNIGESICKNLSEELKIYLDSKSKKKQT